MHCPQGNWRKLHLSEFQWSLPRRLPNESLASGGCHVDDATRSEKGAGCAGGTRRCSVAQDSHAKVEPLLARPCLLDNLAQWPRPKPLASTRLLTFRWSNRDFGHHWLHCFGKEVISFVVNDDECREVHHFNLPHRFHPKFREIQYFNFGDVVLS